MTTRINPYKDIHKGLRKLLLELLQQAGTTDPGDRDRLHELQAQFVRVHDVLDLHSDVEDTLLAPLLDAADVGEQRQQIDSEHHQLHRELNELDEQLAATLAADAAADRLQLFYLHLGHFVGAQLQHMTMEETQIWPLLSRHCDDAAMLQLQARGREMTPPAVMQTLLMAMIPALSASERQLMLKNMHKALTDQAFAKICLLSESVLPEEEWRALKSALDLAVPA